MDLKVNKSMLLVTQKYKLQERQDGIENGKPHTRFLGDETCASAHIRIPD